MSSITYRSEIDGLRAVAVVAVILFHMGATWLPGGFAGVDVFFVISGFLISSIILKEQQKGTFTFASFWTRRIKRIFPVLLAVTFATLLANYLIGYRNESASWGYQSLAAMFSVANIFMWKQAGDYWGAGAENFSFLHFWSLSVEEQFYIIYPLLLVWLLRKKGKLVVPVVVLMTLGSLALFVFASSRYSSASFFFLPTRMWELGAGCLLAVLGTKLRTAVPAGVASILPTLGLALIVLSYFFLPSEQVGLKLALPVIGAALIIGYGRADSGIGRFLSQPAVVYVGLISYSLYLWHWPVIVLARQLNPAALSEPLWLVGMAVVIVGLSLLSYRFIETPLRRSPNTLKLVPGGLAICLVLAGAMIVNDRANSYDTSAFNQVRFQGFKYDVVPILLRKPEQWSDAQRKKRYGVLTDFRAPSDDEAFAKDGIVKRYGGETPTVMLIGDSHATMWSAVIDDVCREQKKTVSFFAAAGVSPFLKLPLSSKLKSEDGFTRQQKRQFDVQRLEGIKKWKPLVILSVRWANNRDLKEMRDLIAYIGECGSRVLLLEQPPEVALNDRNSAQYLSYLGYSSIEGQKQVFPLANIEKSSQGREVLEEITKEFPFCRILKTHDLFAADPKNAYVVDGRDILYYDDDHLSNAGSFRIRSRLASEISAS